MRDVVIHQTGNAAELARVLGAYLANRPAPTRRFDEREPPYRAISDDELWSAFRSRCSELAELSVDAIAVAAPDATVEWTGRTVTVPFFAEHMRSELILHRWDIAGDDATAQAALAEPWMTRHSVVDVGRPLLARGARLADGGAVAGRLRVPDTDDIAVTAHVDGTDIAFAPAADPATIESDVATRVLLLWGRRPADPGRWHSDAGPGELGRPRQLLSGY